MTTAKLWLIWIQSKILILILRLTYLSLSEVKKAISKNENLKSKLDAYLEHENNEYGAHEQSKSLKALEMMECYIKEINQ